GGLADIALQRDGLAAFRLNGFDHLESGGLVLPVIDSNIEPQSRSGNCGGRAYPATGAGNEDGGGELWHAASCSLGDFCILSLVHNCRRVGACRVCRVIKTFAPGGGKLYKMLGDRAVRSLAASLER